MTALELARAEAIDETAAAMLKAAGASLARHGDDPQSAVLLLAAVKVFLDNAESVAPGIRRMVHEITR